MLTTEFGNLIGKRAMVTGASTGIGRAIALELASGGADVLVHCASSVEKAQHVVDEIQKIGQKGVVVQQTFSSETNYQQFVEVIWKEHQPIDIWINNAGVDLLTGDAASWDYQKKLQALIEVDVTSTTMLSHFVGKKMQQAGEGVLLNIGWDQADQGMEGASGELFALTKNSIMGLTRSLAVSLAPEVRVNCIAPGWILTKWGESAGQEWQQRVLDETPLKRWGKPEDIATLVRFLASPQADFITGQIINVNGGAVR